MSNQLYKTGVYFTQCEVWPVLEPVPGYDVMLTCEYRGMKKDFVRWGRTSQDAAAEAVRAGLDWVGKGHGIVEFYDVTEPDRPVRISMAV